MLNFLVVAYVFSGKDSSGVLSGQGGVWFVCMVGGCNVVSGGSARDSSCRLCDLRVYAGYSSNESSCSFAGGGSFNFVLLAVAVVGLVESSSGISASSV